LATLLLGGVLQLVAVTLIPRSSIANAPNADVAAIGPLKYAGKVEEGEEYTSILFSPDGSTFTAERYNPQRKRYDRARLWDARTLRPISPPIEVNGIQYKGFTSDGKTLFLSSVDEARYWDVGTATLRSVEKFTDGLHYFTDISPDGTRLITISRSDEDTLAVRRVGEAKPIMLLRQGGFLLCGEFDPTGKWILTRGHEYRLWNAATGRLACPPIPSDDVSSLIGPRHFDPTGMRLLVHQAKGFTLIDPATGKTLANVSLGVSLGRAEFSSDGKYITVPVRDSSGLETGPCRVYSAATGAFEQEFGSFIGDCQLLPGGRWALCMSWGEKSDKGTQLWDLASGTKVHVFPHAGLHVSPDGSTAVLTSTQGLTDAWHIKRTTTQPRARP
jgi:WD40 repeat protein